MRGKREGIRSLDDEKGRTSLPSRLGIELGVGSSSYGTPNIGEDGKNRIEKHLYQLVCCRIEKQSS